MFDFSWHNLLHSNIFNFLFLFIVLAIILTPLIKKAIEDTTNKTENLVTNSSKDREKALKNLDDVKQDYAKTPEEAEAITKTALNTLKSLEEKAIEDTEKAKQILVDNAEKAVKNEIAKIKSTLSKETAENSIKTATQDIQTKLSQDENLHDKLIEQSINDLEIA